MLSYLLLSNSVVVNTYGQTFNLTSEDPRFKKIIRILKKDLSEADQETALLLLMKPKDKPLPDRFKVLRGGIVMFDGERLHPTLEGRFNQSRSLGLPLEPFKNFITNLSKNPTPSARTSLYKFLEHNGHPITRSGCFIAYKSVRDNLTDWHTGKIDNSPGTVVSMPRDKVVEDPETTCASGLHVAAWVYAKDFGKGDKQVILEIEVDPRDVVSVPNDYDGTKMRVCRYRAIGPCKELNLKLIELQVKARKGAKSGKPKAAKAKPTRKRSATKRAVKSLSKKKKSSSRRK